LGHDRPMRPPETPVTSRTEMGTDILCPMVAPIPSSGDARPRVALFVTCLVDALYPRVGMAAVELLERQGVEVVFPESQTCCGQPAFTAGHRQEARRLASSFLDVFGPLVEGGEVDAVVAPSGSCVATVRHSFQILFEDGAARETLARARLVADHTYELSAYLVDVLGVVTTGAGATGRITYHACCHLLRELGVDRQPRTLLENLRGAELVELEEAEECCGFGGAFSVWNPEISTEMGRRKARHLESTGARLVAVGDVGCMTHINGILVRGGHECRAVHTAELLAGDHEDGE